MIFAVPAADTGVMLSAYGTWAADSLTLFRPADGWVGFAWAIEADEVNFT